MTIDPSFQHSGPKQLTAETRGLLSLALDAYLAGHERVAHDLAALASRLIEMRHSARLCAIAKAILARASLPGQDFATLLDASALAELAAVSLTSNVQSAPSEDAMAILDTMFPSDGQ
jgi:hypothetical protein